MITIDFEKEIQVMYLNIRLASDLKLSFENLFDSKTYDFLISEYCTASNDRFCLFEIPTTIFDLMDKGSYQFELIDNSIGKKLLSGSALVKDSTYVNVELSGLNDAISLNNLDGINNAPFTPNEQVDYGWFDQ